MPTAILSHINTCFINAVTYLFNCCKRRLLTAGGAQRREPEKSRLQTIVVQS